MTKILNTTSVQFLQERDPEFRRIANQYGLPPRWKRPEGFETLCRIILEQQVSLESGKAAYNKLNAKLPSFTPHHILQLTDTEMRAATISRQKTSYLRELAQAIKSKRLNLQLLSTLNEDRCKIDLMKIKGIGPWTAEVYMMFSLQSPDVFPQGDIALIQAAKELWSFKSKEEVVQKAASWSPYRTTAAFFLWHYYLSKRNRDPVF